MVALVCLPREALAADPERDDSSAGRNAVADSQQDATTEIAAQQDAEPAAEKQAAPRPLRGAGLRAYIDPDTGRLVVHPPESRWALALSPKLSNALSTSHEGLTEVVLPDGSAFVHLRGRFHSASLATVGEDGQVRVNRDSVQLPSPEQIATEEPPAAASGDGDE